MSQDGHGSPIFPSQFPTSASRTSIISESFLRVGSSLTGTRESAAELRNNDDGRNVSSAQMLIASSPSTQSSSYYSCYSTPARPYQSSLRLPKILGVSSFTSSQRRGVRSATSDQTALSSHHRSPASSPVFNPPISSVAGSFSLSSSQHSSISELFIDPSEHLSSMAYDSISPSVDDASPDFDDHDDPLPLAEFGSNDAHASHFEDNFTMYLDQRLLALLQETSPSPPASAKFEPELVILSSSRMDVVCCGNEESRSCSCSCSECGSACTTRTVSRAGDRVQSGCYYYDGGKDGNRLMDSESTEGSGSGSGSGSGASVETTSLSRQSSRSSSSTLSSTLIAPAPSSALTDTATRYHTHSVVSYSQPEYEHEERQLTSISPYMLASALASHSSGDKDSWIATGFRYGYDYLCDMYHDDGGGEVEYDGDGGDGESRGGSAGGIVDRGTLNLRSSSGGRKRRRREEDEDDKSRTHSSTPLSLWKRRKLSSTLSTGSGSLTGVKFSATLPASLRRGLSLRSQAESYEGQVDAEKHTLIPFTPLPADDIACPLTVPVTPTPITIQTRPHIFLRNQSHLRYYQPPSPISSTTLLAPVPILAPPPFALIPAAPLCAEDAAEGRLKGLLVREKEMRVADGLWLGFGGGGGTGVELDVGKGGDLEDSFSESAAEIDSPGPETMKKLLRSHSISSSSRADDHTQGLQQLKIDDTFRREVIEWILYVLPPLPIEMNTAAGQTNILPSDLYDQLSTSPETRFHAAYMFIRYLLRVVENKSEKGHSRHLSVFDMESGREDEDADTDTDTDMEPHFLEHATRSVLWDIAVGCLALSVKLHRDVLAPLNSVTALEFLALAPGKMAYDDLETSQRDILQAFSYSLGQNTPQPFFDELWLALPTLRALLDFKDGWMDAKREAWERLLGAVLEPDVLCFPVSLLTVSALITGIILSLADHYEAEADEAIWRQHNRTRNTCRCTAKDYLVNELQREEIQKHFMRRAVRAVDGVVQDMRDLVGLADDDLKECGVWFSRLDAARAIR